MEELTKARADLGDTAKALAEKDATLRDLGLQHVLLARTLFGVTLSSAVKEVALQWSMAPTEDEVDMEKALQTRADLINYIHVLGDDCMANAQDTYASTVAQLKF